MDVFTIENLNFSYPAQQRKAICDFSLTIQQGVFLVLCGPSGCGKSTLLRQLKPALTPHGTRTGTILLEGQPLEKLGQRTQSQRIGFVQQSPENQIVTDKVWHEMAFGMESLGYDTPTIRRRVAEMAAFFGIQTWFHKSTAELSGGQKQLLNLASVMVMQPSVLILDEPTSQLDPIAAADFIAVLGKINRELGTTVILTEHRLEEVFPLATAVAVINQGRLLCSGAPQEVGEKLRAAGHAMFFAMPAAMRIWAAVDSGGPCPVTVRDGREWLSGFAKVHMLKPVPEETKYHCSEEVAVSVDDIWFRYERDLPDVVKGLDLSVKRGEFLALLGGNGTGKTTCLKLLAGLLSAYRGKALVNGRVGVLPQNPQTLFVKKTVREDLLEMLDARKLDASGGDMGMAQVIRLCRLEELLDRHPYDLSGGEQQRVALAKILLLDPDILLLDEPTKGVDAGFKQVFAEILQALLRRGAAVIMVSHDIEFCARYAHRCALLFDGAIVTQGTPRTFFSGNSFYTTAANRMARDLLPEAVTAEDVVAACGGDLLATAALPNDEIAALPPEPELMPSGQPEPLLQRHKLPKRTALTAVLVLLLVPATLLIGESFFSGRKYYFTALLVLLECMAPFFLIFEGRKPQARELVMVAVLCAIGVAGRAALFMLPEFKPVMAISIISGVAFGGETGFLVGAMTMLVSNMMFSQGPWTPWQMFAMGITGFLAGILFQKGLLRRSRMPLCIYGTLGAVLIYGGIMNTASALMWSGELSWGILAAYILSGFPMDCVHAAATGLFLWFAAEPMLEKLDRVKVKYGLLEQC